MPSTSTSPLLAWLYENIKNLESFLRKKKNTSAEFMLKRPCRNIREKIKFLNKSNLIQGTRIRLTRWPISGLFLRYASSSVIWVVPRATNDTLFLFSIIFATKKSLTFPYKKWWFTHFYRQPIVDFSISFLLLNIFCSNYDPAYKGETPILVWREKERQCM